MSEIITSSTSTKSTSPMTMQNIMDKFKSELPDEIEGSHDYLKMASCAEEMSYHNLSRGLYEMAKDEYTHAKFIMDTLLDNDIAIDSEQSAKFKELEGKIHKLFR